MLVLAVAGSALADDGEADGDPIAAVQNSVNLGDVVAGTTREVDVDFVLMCKGSNHLNAGATLMIDETLRDIPPGGAMTVTPVQVVVSAVWPDVGAFCTRTEGPGTVAPARLALTAPTTEGATPFTVSSASRTTRRRAT